MDTKKLRAVMWSASKLAMSVGDSGQLPEKYKADEPYQLGEYEGDVYAIASREHLGIHVGCVGKTKHGIVFSFSGTRPETGDWLNNFFAKQLTFDPRKDAKLHAGFFIGALCIAKKMLDQAQMLAGGNLKQQFYFTGHSKGGALAVITAMLFKEAFPLVTQDQIEVVTFGAPRVGNQQFCDMLDFKITRYENNLDIVPHLPFTQQEKCLLNKMHVFSVFNQLMNFPEYAICGEKICLENKKRRGYYGIPCGTRNQTEVMNSFWAALMVVKNIKEIDEVASIHQDDYNLELS